MFHKTQKKRQFKSHRTPSEESSFLHIEAACGSKHYFHFFKIRSCSLLVKQTVWGKVWLNIRGDTGQDTGTCNGYENTAKYKSMKIKIRKSLTGERSNEPCLRVFDKLVWRSWRSYHYYNWLMNICLGICNFNFITRLIFRLQPGDLIPLELLIWSDTCAHPYRL